MDNNNNSTWQIKCSSSIWQSVTPLMPSSRQLQLQESRNQMLNTGHYLYPHVAQEPSSVSRGMIQELAFSRTPDLSSYNSHHAALGSSFLSLLSGPPSFVQSDLEQLSIPKPYIMSSKVPIGSSNVLASASGNGVSLAPTGFLPQNFRNQNLKIEPDRCPSLSSRVVASANCGNTSGLKDVFRAANLNIQGAERTNEKVNDFSSLRNGGPASAGVLSQTHTSVSHHSSTLSSDCPRVFCLGSSGYLLLSNTGLLGILCSCHGLHMSVSRYSEHSGLSNVNPGDAVRMDSGETIAQWRKLYFHKFGIRVPGDHIGWDWPEGLSPAADLVKCGATMPNTSKTLELSNPVHSSRAPVGSSEESWSNAVFPRNMDQTLVKEVLHCEKQRNCQGSCNFLHKGLIGTSQSNLRHVADKQNLECPVSENSTMSKLVGVRGPGNGFQPSSAYIDSLSQSGGGNLHVSSTNLQNSKNNAKASHLSRFNKSKEGGFLNREVVTSNIELRLGQPSQPSGKSDLPVFGSCLFDTLGVPRKLLPPETLVHNTSNSVVAEDGWKFIQCSADAHGSSTRRERNQLNFVSHGSGICNAIDVSEIEQLKDDASRDSVISMFLSHLKTPERKLQFNETNHEVNDCENAVPKTYRESHIAKYGPSKYSWNRGTDGMESLLSINEIGLQKHMDKVKGVGCVATEPSFRIPAKRIEAMNGSHAVVNGTDNVNDTPDSRSVFNYPGKISCLGFNGNSDNVFVRSVSSPMQSGQPLPLQAVSLGFSTTTSIAIADPISRLPDKEGIGVRPHMLDDSLRNNVFSHVAESANQDHTVTSNETNHAKGRYVNSIHGSSVDQSTSKERCSGLNLTGKHDSCGVSMKLLQCGVTCVGGDGESLAPVTGLNNLCDFSRFLHGISVHSKGVEMQFQHSRAPDPNEQSVLRSENHITQKCCQSAPCCHSVPCTNFPGTFGCADHTGLATNCNIKGKTFLDASTVQAETVGGKTSVLLSSKFGRNDSFSKAKVTSLGLSEKFGCQIQKNDCHGFQWRDVPKKVTGMCSVICEDQPALLDRRAYLDGQLTEARASKRSTQDVNSFKEQEISLISSGCFAPAITQASIEVNKMDSYTVDGADCRFASNLVVDEGSGIDKCLSSDEALESERSDEFRGSSCMLDVINEGSCTVLPNQTSRSLIDELRLQDSLRLKKVRKQLHSAHTTHEKVNYSKKCEKGFKTGKRNRAPKWKVLDASFPASSISSAHKESQKCTATKMLSRSDQKKSQNCACSIGPNFKRRRSAISSSKAISRKRDICGLYNQGDSEKGYQRQFNGTDDTQIPETSVGKKCRLDCTGAIDRMIASTNYPPSVCEGKGRPIVCGKYGVISNGDLSKPAKIIPLRKIFIVATSSRLAEDDKSRVASAKALKKEKVKVIEERFAKFSTNLKTERYNKDNDTAGSSEMDHGNSVEQTETTSYVGDKEYDDVSHVLEKERNEKGERKLRISDDYPSTQRKPKCKETRKRNLYELTVKGKDSSHEIFSVPKISKSIPQTKCRYLGKFLRNTKTCKCNAGQIDNNKKSTTEHQCNSCSSDLDAFCCVCGSSNKDEINCLLECSQCLIRVHQACYGVSKVPKARWYCRPCRTSCKNIVCVLCGYGGGAMTRALRSHNIVKSLLKAWNIVTELRPSYAVSPSKSLEDQLGVLTSRSGIESGSFRIMTAGHIESSFAASCKMDSHQQNESITISSCSNILKVDNSITGGVLDSNVKQWVHMVCGLWTPGTRCPNVDTMSGFDVSGASHPKVDVVCSICYRPGGCCIQCRVVDCSVPFHPWCARQKGLLQSEVEGVDNEGVGFYGRCVLHAMYHHRCHSEGDPVDGQTGHQREKELTCARTEGYKGRKREGYRHNYFHSTSNGGGLVLQEQLNAWLHINGQKSCAKGLLKMSSSNIEHDCRKEYARYKQSKGWKHLVVYKSGIHALGLYTSRFISRGAMVVEYVGEIVGLRVADKRESEYQSGRKLQYKSACYFFRIDKEHIIDATCKGGIARFVNHSCLPNCVAKVICARNEKKVVFFAERDIYPGEEITYDYHFNHEEEGKKIPCFCNAKNCRRYLN